MQVKGIAECILQYFWPSLTYHLSLRPLLYLFLSGRFSQVLLLSIQLSHTQQKNTKPDAYTRPQKPLDHQHTMIESTTP